MTRFKAAMLMGITAATISPNLAHAAAGDFLVRLRGIVVAPTEHSGSVLPAFPGEGVSLDNAVTPEVDFTYMATDHIGFELIAATTKHTASGKTGTTGTIGKLASTWVLPPTLTVQYHLVPEGKVRPYVGAGINYTIFYNEKSSNALESAVGDTKVRLKDSFGWAAQAGVDIDLSKKMFLNFDVKYISMDTVARLDTTAAGTQKVKIDINPLVIGAGVGFRF